MPLSSDYRTKEVTVPAVRPEYVATLVGAIDGKHVVYETKFLDSPSDEDARRKAFEWAAGRVGKIGRRTELQVTRDSERIVMHVYGEPP